MSKKVDLSKIQDELLKEMTIEDLENAILETYKIMDQFLQDIKKFINDTSINEFPMNEDTLRLLTGCYYIANK